MHGTREVFVLAPFRSAVGPMRYERCVQAILVGKSIAFVVKSIAIELHRSEFVLNLYYKKARQNRDIGPIRPAKQQK
jgi:hypothetical protein